MNRRTLLQYCAAGAVTAVAGPVLPGAAARRPSHASAPELEETTVAELQAAMQTGTYTARSIVESYLARIEAIDRHGPAVNSIIELNPDALAVADALDRERTVSGPRGALHGIPVLLKDNIGTADKMRTSAGSLALGESIAPGDAFVVERLRLAGVVIVGKTNLSEWANFRSTRATSGWSARGGQTRNPYALDRNPCGSSSGSAAAVAANLTVLAVGTETDGSIVCPSSACGIVGIKPTLGLVSRTGIVPIAHHQDTAGPMARTVADAAILLGALAGVDPRDAATRVGLRQASADYSSFLVLEGLRGARIGVARDFFGFNERVDQLMDGAIHAMKDEGAIVIDPAKLPLKGKLDDPELEVLLYEFKADLNAYLSSLGPRAPAKSLKELIDFNEKHGDREMPYFGQELFILAEQKGPLTTPAYRRALATCRRLARTRGIDATVAEHRLDAIVAPTGSPAFPTDLVNGDHFTGGSSTPAAVAGYPSVTVPAGFVYGLPVGISFFGAAYSEPVLLRLAYAFEHVMQARKQPRFLATADLVSA